MFTFSVLGRKYLFWANLVQKFKIICLSQTFVIRKIEYAEFSDNVDFFRFKLEIPILGKFGPTN